MLKFNVTHPHAPHSCAHHRLGALFTRHLRGLLHHFDAKRGTAALQCSLKHDVADATAEVE
jgi:hypothetical protein